MPIKNRLAELLPEITAWRRDIHENPELMFDLPRTSNLGRTPGGRALLADPFLVNADRDGDTSSESRR